MGKTNKRKSDKEYGKLNGNSLHFKESARFCINTRLRTPLGGPVQTFEAIERMLLRYITPNQAEPGNPIDWKRTSR